MNPGLKVTDEPDIHEVVKILISWRRRGYRGAPRVADVTIRPGARGGEDTVAGRLLGLLGLVRRFRSVSVMLPLSGPKGSERLH